MPWEGGFQEKNGRNNSGHVPQMVCRFLHQMDMGGKNKVMFKDEFQRTPQKHQKKKKKKASEESSDSKARDVFQN